MQKLKSQGVGILISTHDLNFAAELYNHIVIIRDGSVKLSSTSAEVKTTYGNILLEDLYTKVNTDHSKYIEEIIDDVRISSS
ncbi:hypothetical protein [Virgibacillus sp. YIM 98842]|uniref:hypothetical protein n=1 Tax=Virgibacillus sp. YIM 98842 TaxID=2663533 RepID=UPI0013D98A9B|nr:hypothetical protein [Virgibacillus sp. YIM 98842]